MPKLKNRLPKYRKHSTGKAFVVFNGKRVYLPGEYGSPESRQEYKRLVIEWELQDRPEQPIIRRNEIVVSEIIAKFWSHAEHYYTTDGQPSRTAQNFKPVLRVLNELYGHTLATEFGPLALKAVRKRFIDDGMSRSYVNVCVGKILKLFKWAASEQLVTANVWHELKSVDGLAKGRTTARESPPIRPIEEKTVDATLPFLPAVVRDMVRIQRLTGARSGEVCQLRPCDIDRSGDVWTFTVCKHKSEHHGHRRTIYIGPQCQSILLPFLLRANDAYCFSPSDSERERRAEIHEQRQTSLSYGNRPGSNKRRYPKRFPSTRYTPDSYRRAIVRACEQAFGMPDELRFIPASTPADEKQRLQKLASQWRAKHAWHPHQLRHSMATEVRRRFGIEHAQVTLGHSRADVTQIYAEKNAQLGIEVAKVIG